MTEEKNNVKVIEINELIDNEEKTFASTGYSIIKITKDNKVIPMKIPIKSSGVSELIDEFNIGAPKPPLKNELIQPDSVIGKEMGLTKKEWIKIQNFGDEKYLKEKSDYDNNLGIAIIMKGLNIKFYDINKNEIIDSQKKMNLLKKKGLSGEHFTQLIQDITSLTKWNNEEIEDFLEDN